jgi:hypothetical protein
MLTPVVDAQRENLERLCRRFRVNRLDLFGSAATGQFDPRTSDLDFVVLFEKMSPVEHADAFFGLIEALENLFGRAVDLVEEEPIRNPVFREEIQRTRKTVYEG